MASSRLNWMTSLTLGENLFVDIFIISIVGLGFKGTHCNAISFFFFVVSMQKIVGIKVEKYRHLNV